MTYSLYSSLSSLLTPTEFFTAEAIALSPTIVPNRPGVYGWWFDDAIDPIPLDGCLAIGGYHLLYVGISPRFSRSVAANQRNLRIRLLEHCRGPISSSTLRRSLVAILGKRLSISVFEKPSGKPAISKDDEKRLTAWMSEHARVAWNEHPSPWEVEESLIKEGPRLPLNIQFSSDPFKPHIRYFRKNLI